MALRMDELRKLADREGLKYFLAPDGSRLLLAVRGNHGSFQFMIMLELEGKFLQFRSVSYAHCPVGHAHLPETLQVLGDLNYKMRLVKYGWDPSDGEIVAYADVWIMDGGLTQQQFARIVQNYFATMDSQHPRITKVLESGTDVGLQGEAGGKSAPEGGSPGPGDYDRI